MNTISFSLPPHRRRRPVQKSSRGCAKCKARKIKCDEKKPSCSQCSGKGFKCPGSSTAIKIRWSTKYERLQTNEAPPSMRNDNLLPCCVKSSESLIKSPRSKAVPGDYGNLSPESARREPETPAMSFNLDERRVYDDTNGIFETERHGVLHSSEVDIKEVSPVFEDDRGLSHVVYFHPATRCWDFGKESFTSDFPEPCLFTESDATHSYEISEGGLIKCASVDIQSPSMTLPSPKIHCDNKSPLSPELLDIQSDLVGFYFAVVCPIFSTFDSEANLFRSFVSQNWHHSTSMFYAMLSMAAGKVARRVPSMRAQGLQYQSLALSNICAEISTACGWTVELLFAVVMLGLSTSWHNITDLGITHLRAVQKALHDDAFQLSCDSQILDFFRNAEVYWEMVVNSVHDDISNHDSPSLPQPPPTQINNTSSSTCLPLSRIIPHPFTGVASAPQALFSRVAQLIRQVRPFNSSHPLVCQKTFMDSLDALEHDIWLLELPKLHEIVNTGDPNTPTIHHLLLAEAYMFANLYQLYYVFPNHRYRRAKLIRERLDNSCPFENSWAGQQARSWSSILYRGQGTKKWLNFLGRNIIIRLEQIQVSSGTSCIHPLLLLVGSGSLSVPLAPNGSTDANDILEARRFVINRLSCIIDLILSEPIDHVKSVVLEMFNRLDVGVDVFWMDMLHSMGVITIIG